MKSRNPFLGCRGLTLAALLIAALLRPPHAPAQGVNPNSFTPPQIIQMPGGAGGIAAADFDNDGNVDLVVDGGTQISILYGRGDGTFDSPVSYAAVGPLNHVLPVDVNGDGKIDLVCAFGSANSVVVILNLGNRLFGLPAQYPVGTQPYGVAAGDFDGDGFVDLAASNDLSNNVTILRNRGDGTFQTTLTLGAGSFPARVAAADLNQDGKVDLIVPNYVSADLWIYRGDGRGNFSRTGDYGVGNYPATVTVADLNGDGKLDIASANTFDHTITVLFGDGAGNFGNSATFPGNTYPSVIEAADLDQDGLPDLIASNNGQTYFTVLRNLGGGVFDAPLSFDIGGANNRGAAVADLNGDGLPDVATSSEVSGTVAIRLNNSVLPAPSQLIASAMVRGQIDLSWKDNSTGELGFVIQRRTSTTGFADLRSVGPNVTTLSDTGLPDGASYVYRVRAFTDTLTSHYSNEADATTLIPTYTLSGTVTEGTNGLAGVTVTAGTISASTDPSGAYRLTVPAGNYTVTPSLVEYTFSPAAQNVTVTSDLAGVDFSAARVTYTVTGTVRQGASGVGGVTVTAGDASAVTATDGTYALSGLVSGTYAVTPALAEYTFAPASRFVTVGPSRSSVNFAATRFTYSMSGTVRDGAAGAVGVVIRAGGATATTGAEGTYTLTGLISGTYTVSASRDSAVFNPASRSVTLGPSAGGIDFLLIHTFGISGKVTLKGKPLAGVTLNSEGGSATSKADGTYDIDGLVAGLYHVTPALAGYAFVPSSRPVRVGPAAANINFTARALPPPPALASISLRPAAVKQGRFVRGTVTLTAVTHSAVAIALSSTDPAAAPVPSSVSVLAGSRAASFNFIAGQVAKATPVAISATYNSIKRSANLTVKP